MVGILSRYFRSRKRRSILVLVVAALIWIVAFPSAFLNLWLTPDQQGRLWFQMGDYEKASRSFEDPRWKGFSLYAGEEFDTAGQYFSQYQDAESLLARANALAHSGGFYSALDAYQELAKRHPDHPAPEVNIPIMLALIEASDGQVETRQEKSGKKPGEGSESSDGDGEAGEGEREQYSAGQLLQDPGLTEMWLRQIQRDPSEFLSTKFYLQIEQAGKEDP